MPVSTRAWKGDESRHTAIHDPVPFASEVGICGESHTQPHALECEVQRALLSLPDVEFSTLRVFRLHDGVCLTGTVRAPGDCHTLFQSAAETVDGVQRVLNLMVVQNTSDELPSLL